MKVTEKDVQHVADLANLELTTAERARYIKDLNSILSYIEILDEVDTSQVGPFTGSTSGSAELMRDDERRTSLAHDSALMNAPATDGIFFLVPKVIDKSSDPKK